MRTFIYSRPHSRADMRRLRTSPGSAPKALINRERPERRGQGHAPEAPGAEGRALLQRHWVLSVPSSAPPRTQNRDDLRSPAEASRGAWEAGWTPSGLSSLLVVKPSRTRPNPRPTQNFPNHPEQTVPTSLQVIQNEASTCSTTIRVHKTTQGWGEGRGKGEDESLAVRPTPRRERTGAPAASQDLQTQGYGACG